MKQILTILLLTFSTSVFSQEVEKYDYMTISQVLDMLYISTGADKFEEVKIKDELEHKHLDNTPVLKRIEESENEGWVFVSANQSWIGAQASYSTYTATMRRKK